MKNRRRLLAWLLTVAMTVPVVPVYAVESADNEAVVIEEATATEEVESVEESQVETESALEDEMLSETVVTVEDTSEVATTEEETTVIQTETTTEEETTEAKIEELDSSFKLDDKDKKLKAEMAGSMGQLDSAVPGIDYVANEVYLLTDSQTEAEAVAEAFGGTIKNFNCGVATVTLPDDISVAEAVAFGADEDTNMFAVMPNFYARLYDDYEDEYSEVLGTTIEETEENGDIDILEVFETEIEEEELELEGNVDAAYTDPYLHNGSDKYQYQHNSLGSVYAWKAGYTGEGIKVAVIDSGVKPITLNGKTELPVEYDKSCYSGSTSALDENDHGTHVAGIIAARLNGEAGAGIAPNALIYNIRVGDADGSITYADEYAGLREAINKNVDVVNMSLGGIWTTAGFQDLVDEAYNKGIAIFASSGNDGGQIDSYPACYNHVMSIGSTNEIDARSDFSNTNSRVAFCGPGSRIWSTNAGNEVSGDYRTMSGTSMSCPAISGVAAVILSTPEYKGMTKNSAKVDALRNLMTKNSKYVMAKCGAGIPSLPRALGITTEGDKPKSPEITYKVSSDYKTINFEVKGQPFSNIIYTTNGKVPNLKTPVAGQQRVNNSTTGIISVPVSKNRIVINAIAVNESGLASPVKSLPINVKPYVASIGITGITKLAVGKTAALSATVLPDIAVNKKLNWSISPANQGVKVVGGKVVADKTAKTGTYTVTAVAADGGGANKNYKIEVIAGEYIKSVAFTEKQVIMNRKASNTTKDISGLLNGLGTNGSKLAVSDFAWSSNKPAIATVSSAGVITATGAGTAVITALANDGSGKKATISVKVNQQINTITLNCNSTKVAVGKKVTIKTTLNPEKPTSAKLNWTVSPAGKGVTVVNGNVSVAKDAVNTDYTITATAADGGGASASKKITVIAGGITTITPNVKSEVLFRVSDTINETVSEPTSKVIRVTVKGDMGADTGMLTATSNNTGIVTVSGPVKSGSFYDFTVAATGNQTGSAVITIASTDGSAKVAKVNIKVINPASSITVASVNSETMDKIIEGKIVKLKANLGTLYGTPGVNKVKWTIKEVYPSEKTQYVNVSAGVVKVKNGVGHQTSIVVTAEVMDGSGLKTDITLKTVGKSHAVNKMYLADWNRYWNYNYLNEISKTVYLRPDPESAVFIGAAMRVDSIDRYTVWVKDLDMSCVHLACSSGNNAAATPMLYGPQLYVSPKKDGSTTIIVADKVSGKSCKYRIIVTSNPRYRDRCIN